MFLESIRISSSPSDISLTRSAILITASPKTGKLVGQVMASFQTIFSFSATTGAAFAASALGACIIERHITLDRTMDGPDHAASLEPQGFSKMVRDIRQVDEAMGTGNEKYFTMGEILNREVLAKSLVATRRIEPGEKISRDMVTVKGPGQGLSPQRYTQLIGRTIDRVIEPDEPFLPRDLGQVVSLDIEHTLPMEWGFVVRFNDFRNMLHLNPPLLEFHFTDKDLDVSRTRIAEKIFRKDICQQKGFYKWSTKK